MTKSLTTLFLSASLLFGACGGEDEPEFVLDSSLNIENGSSYSFVEINLSPVNADAWGEDLLGSDILEPGDVLELSGIECDDYDIRVIDEELDECIVTDVDLCLTDEHWVVTDSDLLDCFTF